MPDPHSWTLRALLLGALGAIVLLVPATAGATRPADIRVVTDAGETLGEHTQYTGKVRIKARKRADCFGQGTGGSGKKTTVRGATALGLTEDARRFDRDLAPLLVTDFFDFGLGLCAIGGVEPPASGFWYLKVNHVAAQAGADQVRLKSGDQVLWWLDPDFGDAAPAELMLRARARDRDGTFSVRVWEYDDGGSRTPAAGAQVTGAEAPTGADGRTTVSDAGATAASDGATIARLRATRAGAIPSNVAHVCVGSFKVCQSKPPATIFGSNRRDVIRGTRGNDEITAAKGRDIVRAKRGDDTIDVRGGGKDRVRCGGGFDTVRADRRDVLKGCEA